ncbi:SpaH/EbpB family LPXTG-anchored major pilin [Plantibacter sp. CFBP 13570]|uniref:SpaH/EbpB family LPXTG-anchored major pilin n=1 Tax=Plantibacter sp. CFBP 13570 TaxID=2775272 RepID=UPI0019309C5B|nr:SpaH/EbpB family LPXTG-anchored major pilin [Plantibacter sp. CFBP 13570]MBD8535592.1 SpaH/EbpB family LPXTG-anchored major pilin [Plantibacter sp. CFBP 13570]
MTNPAQRRLLRAAAATLVGGALALGSVGSAYAATSSTIDATQSGSLTIHKYEQPKSPTDLPHDGRELSAADLTELTPLPGVEFTATKVAGVDLTTNAGWESAQAMTTTTAASAVSTAPTDIHRGVTAADGTLSLTGLDLGLYYVTESKAPAGVVPSAPFLVTLPLTNPLDQSSWMYDVHVYPKNFAAHTEKTVSDSSTVAVGDDVTWTVRSILPIDGTDGYQLTDTLDKRLTFKSADVSINGTKLDAADYTSSSVVSSVTGRATVLVKLTDLGLAKANLPVNKGAAIEFALVTTIKELGDIKNVAEIYDNADDITNKTPSGYTPGHPDEENPTPQPNDPTDPNNPFDPIPGDDAPVTKFGELTINKISAADSKVLSGAKFQVYTSLDAAKAQDAAGLVTIGSESVWTSDAKGRVSIAGLRYSNWENNAAIADQNAWKHYWLVETAAPAGFELLAEPVQFDITSNDATVVDLDVKNVPGNGGFFLPITGGAGGSLLMGAGVLLVVGAVVLTIRNRRADAKVAQ